MHNVTIITPTLPRRRTVLLEALATVDRQTIQPVAHLIGVDTRGLGPAYLRTNLVHAANSDWVAFLDDDDLLDANHLEELFRVADEWDRDLDVIYSYCRFIGPPLPPQYYNQEYSREALRERGIFPITVLARRDSIIDCGGFNEIDTYEDWSLWNRMADAGCEFGYSTEITWTYRTGHQSRTTEAMEGAR